MQPPLKPLTKPGIAFRRWAIALLLAAPMVVSFGLPAQANLWQTLRGILTGDTGEGARGNTRGAAIRDRRCSAAEATVNSDEERAQVVTPDSPTANPDNLLLLLPNTDQTLIATTAPEVFVYIPPQIPGLEGAASFSSAEPTTLTNQTKIDLEDIDSVVDEDIKAKVEQAERPELLLEFQFGDVTRYYSLPEEAVIANISAPEGTAFERGEIIPMEVRLVCRRTDLAGLSQPVETEISYSVESEVFVNVQRVQPGDQWIDGINAIDTGEQGQVDQDDFSRVLWFDLVAALAAKPESQEWASFLEALGIPEVDLTPQTLTPAAS